MYMFAVAQALENLTEWCTLALLFLADSSYRIKLVRGSEESTVESCYPNPCLNGGKCMNRGSDRTCQCTSHFTGEILMTEFLTILLSTSYLLPYSVDQYIFL
jgi:hypothetical protein